VTRANPTAQTRSRQATPCARLRARSHARLKHAGIHLVSILKLDAMMTQYQSVGLIDDEQYQRYLDYVQANGAGENLGEE